MKEIKSRFTGIRQIIDIGDGLVVLENSFKYPLGISNLYKISYEFKPLWDAEVRNSGLGTDHYANFVYQNNDGTLSCAGSIGSTYTLDASTGKILKEIYDK